MRVMVILDRAYGARDHHPLGSAFWLIESPENRRLAERVWSALKSDPNSAILKGDGYLRGRDPKCWATARAFAASVPRFGDLELASMLVEQAAA